MKRILRVSNALGFLASSMSVVLLIQYGVKTGSWGIPFQAMIKSWDQMVGVLFTDIIPLGPLLEYIIKRIAETIGWIHIPKLYPHWKHVLVLLMTIYASFTKRTFVEGKVLFGIYGLLIGFLFALISALAVGVIPQSAGGFLSNFLVAVIPTVSFWATIYLVWAPQKGIFGKDLGLFFARSAVSIIFIALAVAVSVKIDLIRINFNIGLFCLLGVVIYVAFNRIYCGYCNSKRNNTTFLSDPLTQRGLLILSGFIGATIFVLLNAGWSLIGQ